MKELYSTFITEQIGIHENLEKIISKNAFGKFLRPIPSHQMECFEKIKVFMTENRPAILDSFVGTGISTRILAKKFPKYKVLGIDRSLKRLKNEVISGDNFLIIRGNVLDLWPLLANEGFFFKKHFIFYPNPYPKKTRIKNRFYAHPVFMSMLKLSLNLEVRTNWEIFALELFYCLKYFGKDPKIQKFYIDKPISLFEKKYKDNCTIYRVFI